MTDLDDWLQCVIHVCTKSDVEAAVKLFESFGPHKNYYPYDANKPTVRHFFLEYYDVKSRDRVLGEWKCWQTDYPERARGLNAQSINSKSSPGMIGNLVNRAGKDYIVPRLQTKPRIQQQYVASGSATRTVDSSTYSSSRGTRTIQTPQRPEFGAPISEINTGSQITATAHNPDHTIHATLPLAPILQSTKHQLSANGIQAPGSSASPQTIAITATSTPNPSNSNVSLHQRAPSQTLIPKNGITDATEANKKLAYSTATASSSSQARFSQAPVHVPPLLNAAAVLNSYTHLQLLPAQPPQPMSNVMSATGALNTGTCHTLPAKPSVPTLIPSTTTLHSATSQDMPLSTINLAKVPSTKTTLRKPSLAESSPVANLPTKAPLAGPSTQSKSLPSQTHVQPHQTTPHPSNSTTSLPKKPVQSNAPADTQSSWKRVVNFQPLQQRSASPNTPSAPLAPSSFPPPPTPTPPPPPTPSQTAGNPPAGSQSVVSALQKVIRSWNLRAGPSAVLDKLRETKNPAMWLVTARSYNQMGSSKNAATVVLDLIKNLNSLATVESDREKVLQGAAKALEAILAGIPDLPQKTGGTNDIVPQSPPLDSGRSQQACQDSDKNSPKKDIKSSSDSQPSASPKTGSDDPPNKTTDLKISIEQYEEKQRKAIETIKALRLHQQETEKKAELLLARNKEAEEKIKTLTAQHQEAKNRIEDILLQKRRGEQDAQMYLAAINDGKSRTDVLFSKNRDAEEKIRVLLSQKREAEDKTTALLLEKREAEAKAEASRSQMRLTEEKLEALLVQKLQAEEKVDALLAKMLREQNEVKSVLSQKRRAEEEIVEERSKRQKLEDDLNSSTKEVLRLKESHAKVATPEQLQRERFLYETKAAEDIYRSLAATLLRAADVTARSVQSDAVVAS